MSDTQSAKEKDTVSKAMQNSVVYYDATKWAATPANNGGDGPSWQWGNELLIGFTVGKFSREKSIIHPNSIHQCDYDFPFDSWLARSTDGGETWTAWKPERYAGQDRIVQDPTSKLDFTQDGFLMRIEGFGYHGNEGCQWFYSENKGMTWQGPFGFGDLMLHPELKGKEFTGRTAYIIGSPHELYLFLAVRERSETNLLGIRLNEETFLARTTDGGKTFTFISWIVPWGDPYRAVMPAPVRISQTKIVVAIRRKSKSNNWIDCYESTNNGKSWSFLSKVAYTEDANKYNGNPPALIQMQDYRLCCVFGNRSTRQLSAKYSEDEGKSWRNEQILRSDFHSVNGGPDLGYPRLFQRLDGKLVTAYFWCTENKPQAHIEATIF